MQTGEQQAGLQEKAEMLVLYSSGRRKSQRVVTVFVGGKSIPSSAECHVALTMDPEIETPVLVIPFGGLPFAGIDDDDSLARTIIWQTTPNYVDDCFSYRCTRIRDLLLIKVLVVRTFCRRHESTQAELEVTNEIHLN